MTELYAEHPEDTVRLHFNVRLEPSEAEPARLLDSLDVDTITRVFQYELIKAGIPHHGRDVNGSSDDIHFTALMPRLLPDETRMELVTVLLDSAFLLRGERHVKESSITLAQPYINEVEKLPDAQMFESLGVTRLVNPFKSYSYAKETLLGEPDEDSQIRTEMYYPTAVIIGDAIRVHAHEKWHMEIDIDTLGNEELGATTILLHNEAEPWDKVMRASMAAQDYWSAYREAALHHPLTEGDPEDVDIFPLHNPHIMAILYLNYLNDTDPAYPRLPSMVEAFNALIDDQEE